jgi:DNA-binding Xre family transcriptional regulator
MSKEKTVEQIREEFLNHVRHLIQHWVRKRDRDCEGKMEGLMFSTLALLDGVSVSSCGFIVAPHTHPDDKNYRISQGADYYPENHKSNVKGDISGNLHDLFYKNQPPRTFQPESVRSSLKFSMPSYLDLVKFRKQCQLTLRDVSNRTAINISTLSRIERGKEAEHGTWIQLCSFYSNLLDEITE